MYDDLVAGRGLTPGAHLASVTALAVSWLVLAGVVGVAGYLGWLVVAGSGWLRWPGAAFLAGVLWCVRPRAHHLSDDVVALDRAAAPHLWAVVDRLAAAVGVATPQILGVDTRVNASVMAVGRRRRYALVIGLPMWDALDMPERLALLGHELGHLAHRDVRRGGVNIAALEVLGQLAALFVPDVFDERDTRRALGAFGLTMLVRRALAAPFAAVYRGQLRLVLRSKQRQEYLADLAAAEVAGATAAVAVTDLLLSADLVWMGAQTAARQGADPWEAIARRVPLPARELLRRRRVSELTGHRTSSTHPPTHLRADLIRQRGAAVGTLTFTPHEVSVVESEIAPLRAQLDRQFRDQLQTLSYG